MKKVVKTSIIIDVYSLIKEAKYTKMSEDDKISIWKIFKVIKPIGEAFNKDLEDARKEFLPYDSFMEDWEKARQYEIAKEKKETYDKMSDEDYKKFIGELVKYNGLINKAIIELLKKEVELEYEPISSDGFDQLRLSNDWTLNQGDLIESLVCE